MSDKIQVQVNGDSLWSVWTRLLWLQTLQPTVEYPFVVCDLFPACIGSSFRPPNNCTEKCI